MDNRNQNGRNIPNRNNTSGGRYESGRPIRRDGGDTRGQSRPPYNSSREAMEAARRRAEAKRAAEARRLRKERERRERTRRAITGVFVFAVILAVIVGTAALIMWKCFSSAPDADPEKTVIYRYGGESNSEKLSYDKAFVSGKLYVNFTKVAEYLSMTSSGDSESMRFLFRRTESSSGSAGDGKEEYVIFTSGSNTANINSQNVLLDGAAQIRDGKVLVPASFIRDHMLGVSAEYTPSDGVVLITRTLAPSSTKDNIVYEELAFTEKPSHVIPPMTTDTSDLPGTPETPKFTADLSAYEQYMNPSEYEEYLLLANKTTTLSPTFKPADLTDIKDTRNDRNKQQMRLYAAKALEALFIELRAVGMEDYNSQSGQVVSVMSGFRTYAYQEELFNRYIEQEKNDPSHAGWSDERIKELVLTYSAYPGTSEHQTGLCVDMHNLPSANVAYKNQKSYEWLCENAWKFGFILRYPEDKVAITGYGFEPWHWRYVGRTAAYTIHKNGLCLEEYLEDIGR